MKKLILNLALGLTATTAAFTSNAQCSNTPNNYEVKLSHTAAGKLQVAIRYTKADALLPTTETKLDGLVFAIEAPSADFKITNCVNNSNTVFSVMPDNGAQAAAQNKTATNPIFTFYHNNIEGMPLPMLAAWTANEWITIANVSYSGTLKENQHFSLLNCDYGLAHPNSYYGNSTTDPWLALFSKDNQVTQVAPKMTTELPTKTTIFNYTFAPNPTTSKVNFNIDITEQTSAIAKVVNTQGSVVKVINFNLDNGSNKVEVDLTELPSGVYQVQVTDGKLLQIAEKITKN